MKSLNQALAVWKALFIRESLIRLSAKKGAWVWLLLEPVLQVGLLMFLFGFIYHRELVGIDGAMFVMIGLLSFMLPRRTIFKGMSCIKAAKPLFFFREIRPIDMLLVSFFVEALIVIFASIFLVFCAGLIGYSVIPGDLSIVLLGYVGLWLFGIGLGLIVAISANFFSYTQQIVGFVFRPIYLLSGVIFPIWKIPEPYREWLMLNPIAHGLETIRHGFYPHVYISPKVHISYLYETSIVLVLFGLFLYSKFENHLVKQ